MMKFTVNDLVYIGEAAKSLKQRDFVFTPTYLIGLDNIKNYLCYVELDTNFLSNPAEMYDCVINAKELSAFIKTITLESEFIIDETKNIDTIATTSGSLNIRFEKYNIRFAKYKLEKVAYDLGLHTDHVKQSVDVTNELSELFSLKKADGIIYFKYNGYFMTLFSGLLPINKSDKIHLTIYNQSTINTFIANFTIIKKKFKVNIYLAYLNIRGV